VFQLLLLNALILAPVGAYVFARARLPNRVFFTTGVSFGIIVAPFSLGLYAWFHVSAFGLIPGLVGLFLSLIHETPGFQLAIFFGFAHGSEIASSTSKHLIVEILNGVFWSVSYGFLGYLVDIALNKRKRT